MNGESIPADPAVQALLDQLGAATDEARARAVAAARSNGRSGRIVDTDVTEGPVAEICARLAQRALDGRLGLCRHLPLGASPRPMYWLPSRPSKVRCLDCTQVVANAVQGTRENSRCDVCGRLRLGGCRVDFLLSGPLVIVCKRCSGCRVEAFGTDDPDGGPAAA